MNETAVGSEQPDFAKGGGLLPAVIQDQATGEVLMLGFMNEEAYQLTMRTGLVHYWSRKKKRLWKKGEESGHVQHVRQLFLDNDNDTLLVQVHQIGGAVEDGYRSCFFRQWTGHQWQTVGDKLFDPAETYPGYADALTVALPLGSLEPVCRQLLATAGLNAPSLDRKEPTYIGSDPPVKGLWAPADREPESLWGAGAHVEGG